MNTQQDASAIFTPLLRKLPINYFDTNYVFLPALFDLPIGMLLSKINTITDTQVIVSLIRVAK